MSWKTKLALMWTVKTAWHSLMINLTTKNCQFLRTPTRKNIDQIIQRVWPLEAKLKRCLLWVLKSTNQRERWFKNRYICLFLVKTHLIDQRVQDVQEQSLVKEVIWGKNQRRKGVTVLKIWAWKVLSSKTLASHRLRLPKKVVTRFWTSMSWG